MNPASGRWASISPYDALEERVRQLETKLRMTEGAFKNNRIRELESALKIIASYNGSDAGACVAKQLAQNALDGK